jgi:hypothetical protein
LQPSLRLLFQTFAKTQPPRRCSTSIASISAWHTIVGGNAFSGGRIIGTSHTSTSSRS